MTAPEESIDVLLNQLVSIPSVTGDIKAAENVASLTSQILKPTGMTQVKGEFNHYPYLMAYTKKPNENMIWFVCHLDVVPASEKMFHVTSDEKNYYGRGVFDMKGMAASVLSALLRTPDLKNRNVGLLFTTDEETGGKNGVGALVDKKFRGGSVFVFDQSADWVLQEKMKGIIWLEITASGQAAHGARPWLGQSANREMIEYLASLTKWYEKTIPRQHPDNYYTTFNIGTLHGGEATNQVNDTTISTIDVRFVHEAEAVKVIDAARSLALKFRGIAVKKLMHEPCVNTDTQNYWYKETRRLMKGLGIVPGSNGERYGHGSTDGRFFAPFDVPVVTTRPPGGGQHGAEEWVSKQGLQQLEALCAELIGLTK